jgi:hypothetical protein
MAIRTKMLLPHLRSQPCHVFVVRQFEGLSATLFAPSFHSEFPVSIYVNTVMEQNCEIFIYPDKFGVLKNWYLSRQNPTKSGTLPSRHELLATIRVPHLYSEVLVY